MNDKKFFKKWENFSQGFTLIELMVSLTIFIVVVGSGLGVFLSFYRSQRQVQQLQDVLDNSRLALERMTKSIRVSCVKTATTSVSGMGTTSLSFYHFRRDKDLKYTLDQGKVVEIDVDSGEKYALTGEKIKVRDLRFYVQNVGEEGGEFQDQPLVTIILAVEPILENMEGETISLQTSVSQRCLEDREACHP